MKHASGLFLASHPKQLPFGFVSNSHTQLEKDAMKGTDVGMRKRVEAEERTGTRGGNNNTQFQALL